MHMCVCTLNLLKLSYFSFFFFLFLFHLLLVWKCHIAHTRALFKHNREVIKDVSVTIVPLPFDKIDSNTNELKKVRIFLILLKKICFLICEFVSFIQQKCLEPEIKNPHSTGNISSNIIKQNDGKYINSITK